MQIIILTIYLLLHNNMIKDGCIEGTIIYKWAPEKVNENFTKMTMVLQEIDWGEYVQSMAIEFTNKGIEFADKFNVLDNVSVEIKSKANEWKGKYFNSLKGWKIKKIEANNNWGEPLPF